MKKRYVILGQTYAAKISGQLVPARLRWAIAKKGICLRCEVGDYGREKRPDGLIHQATVPCPSQETLSSWLFSDGDCEATDGCIVEPDGRCPHGHTSWLRVLKLI